jgi:hypothetical protein
MGMLIFMMCPVGIAVVLLLCAVAAAALVLAAASWLRG